MAISKFKKDLGISTTSSILSFAISLGLTPIMTRLYAPEDYGIFSLINTIGMFLATLALFSMQSAFSIEKSFIRKVQLLGSLTGITILSFIIISFFTILAIVFIDSITWHFLFLPLLVLSAMTQRIFFSLSVSHEKFKDIAKARVIHPFVAKVFSIIAAFISQSNAIFLIIFESLGYFIQTYILFKNKESKNLKRYIKNIFNFQRYKSTLKRYSHFASYFHLSNLVFIGFTMLQVVIISINYSEKETGLFSLASSMSSLPVQLLSLALASVLYAKMINIYNDKGNLLKFVFKTIFGFSLIGLIPYGIIYFYGTNIFSLVFGDKWQMSGTIASIICLNLYMYFIFMPIESLFTILKQLKIKFIINLLGSSLIMVSFYYWSLNFSFINAIKYLSISLFLYYFLLTFIVLFFVSRSKYD